MNYIFLIVGIIVFLGIIMFVSRVGKPDQKVPIDSKDLTDSNIKDLVKKGEKLLAIKYYRELHHCGLKDAKDRIDEIST